MPDNRVLACSMAARGWPSFLFHCPLGESVGGAVTSSPSFMSEGCSNTILEASVSEGKKKLL